MIVAETPRLRIRHFTASDTQFTLVLLNDASFINNIADRGVRNEQEALDYLLNGPIKSYNKYGYGLFLVEHVTSAEPMGICGLIFRPELQETDIGFAFLPQFCGQGYATEAAKAVFHYGYQKLKLARIVGLTNAGNINSINLLAKLGLQFEKTVMLAAQQQQVLLFS
jgi:[ribosomal protein S5]-alanine N-acetyltransferase